MAIWQYSNYVTLDGAARLTQLRLHIQEVSNRITEDYTNAGRSKSVQTRESYLSGLQQQEKTLGGQSPRANGRSRTLTATFRDSGGVD